MSHMTSAPHITKTYFDIDVSTSKFGKRGNFWQKIPLLISKSFFEGEKKVKSKKCFSALVYAQYIILHV